MVTLGVLALGFAVSRSGPSYTSEGHSPRFGETWERGVAGARVTIETFPDFSCPVCLENEWLIRQALIAYGNDLKIVYRHFPSLKSEFALKAAEALEAAGEQGKFWEMHDLIVMNRDKVTVSDFEAYAQRLGSDMQKFEQAMATSQFRDKVVTSRKNAEAAGITYPTVFINGKELQTPRSFDELRRVIDAVLGKSPVPQPQTTPEG